MAACARSARAGLPPRPGASGSQGSVQDLRLLSPFRALPGGGTVSAATAPFRAPEDTDARARALDPSASFIVQAPAGSGKTTLLVRRFIALLGQVTQPESIV